MNIIYTTDVPSVSIVNAESHSRTWPREVSTNEPESNEPERHQQGMSPPPIAKDHHPLTATSQELWYQYRSWMPRVIAEHDPGKFQPPESNEPESNEPESNETESNETEETNKECRRRLSPKTIIHWQPHLKSCGISIDRGCRSNSRTCPREVSPRPWTRIESIEEPDQQGMSPPPIVKDHQ